MCSFDPEDFRIMKGRALKGIVLVLLAMSVFLASGCASEKHYRAVEKKALEYYQDKYGLEDITVTDSYKAGNSGLFGYLDVEDRAYEMSDGNSVFWDEDNERFSDNAQADEINEAFRSQILEPLLSEFTVPLKTTEQVFLNRTAMDSFDECVFTDLYEGDIDSFLKKVKPQLWTFTVALETEDRERGEKEITDFYNSLGEYVKGWSYAYILDSGLDELTGEDWIVDDKELNVTASARYDFKNNEIKWYRQKYIEVYEGVYVTSHKSDFVFNEGDVIFEEAGTCAELQKMLDDAYYAMPVDAEENANGGYTKEDQRHESRVILDDTSLPYFKVILSQRVMDELDDRGEISVYFLYTRDDGKPLMKYYGKESSNPYSVFRVCKEPTGRGEYGSLSPDNIYYFGTHTLEAYEDEAEEEETEAEQTDEG